MATLVTLGKAVHKTKLSAWKILCSDKVMMSHH